MLAMMIGTMLVYAGVLGYALFFDTDSSFADRGVLATVVVSAFIAPVLAVWLTAEVLNILRRRRLFERGGASRWWRRATLGTIIAVVGLVIGTVLMALLDTRLPDAPLMAMGAVLPTIVAFAFLPRARRGRCRKCQYDLAGMTVASGGVCPECGAGVMHAS